MPAGQHDFTCEMGATFARTVTWEDSAGTPINLTGYTARMMVKKAPGQTAVISLTSASGGGLTLGGAAGTIAIAITATVTAALTAGPYKYDLELASGAGVVTRLLEGSFTIKPEVTV